MSEAVAAADPFAEMDRAYGAGVVRDPYPVLRRLRREAAVQPTTPHELFGIPLGPPPGPDSPPIYTLLSHEAVYQVLRDGETFSSSIYEKTMGIVMGHTILEMDEPQHRRYRGLLQKAFTRKALARWESELIRPSVERLVSRFADRGSAELRRELTFPFPVNVIAALLGLPDDDLEQFHRWAVELISVGFDWERALAASAALGGYFGELVARRRREPRDDMVSVLAHAELDGSRLQDADIVAFLRLLLPAGAETTYRSSSNLLFGLLTHVDQLEAIRRDRSLIPQAIEEGLRWEAPLTTIMRVCTRDSEVAGFAIPAGAMLSVCLAAANHDEKRYESPERFDIFRPQRQHVAFGFGPHRCLGMHLARIETQVLLDTLLDRLPGLRLDPESDDVHITGLIFRTPNRLPVVFDAAG